MVTSNKPHDRVPEMKPGYILQVDFEEIDEFEARAKKFRIGDEDQTTFQLFRLSRGTYGQRQEDNQMMRIKLPSGGVTGGPDGRAGRGLGEVLRPPPRPHHHPRELPVPLRQPGRHGRGHAHHRPGRPDDPRGLRPHGAQHHRLPLRRHLRRTRSSTRRLTSPPTRATCCATRSASACRASSRPPSPIAPPTAPAPFHDLGFIGRKIRATARRSWASRCASAAAPRRCPAWPTWSGSSPASTTASTSASPRRSCGSSTARATCRASCART